MFNNYRYVTRGVLDSLEIPIQIFLWELIDKLEGEKDYLQVFELKQISEDRIKIIHRQEVQEYRKEYMIKGTIGTNIKLFVIDSGEYSTLLKSSEY